MAVELPEPKPKIPVEPYKPFSWPGGPTFSLGQFAIKETVDLHQLVLERQSRRTFSPLPLEKLEGLLSICCRTYSWSTSDLGFEQQFRGVPSAGAIHPIHVLVQRYRHSGWERYDPINHSLVEIPGSHDLASAARVAADAIVASGDATLIALVAEPGKTAAKYYFPESLIWRDAGIIIGALAWSAEALSLNICPLGATGTSFVSLISREKTLIGVGLVLIGGRPE
ncbi:nitroreductase family protein [Lampropedia aestuarii]|nr:nitroreductase family protein [Lampropedia aestuarii]